MTEASASSSRTKSSSTSERMRLFRTFPVSMALELDYLSSHLVVVGGGYSGLEFAQAYRRFGSNVTIVEVGPDILSREDPDIAQEMRRILNEERIEIVAGAELVKVNGRSGEKVSLILRTSSGERTVEGSEI